MKKKLFLIVVVILVAIFVCMAFVACGGNADDNNNNSNENNEIIQGGNENDAENVLPENATISQFLEVWKKSTKKSVIVNRESWTIYGNKFYYYDNEIARYFEVNGKNNIDYYYGPIDSIESEDTTNWDIFKLDNIGDICAYLNCDLEYLPELNATKDYLNAAINGVFAGVDFDLDFEKIGDTYYGKGPQYENYTIKIVDKTLTYFMKWEINNNIIEAEYKFVLGSEPIIIPQFLKDAMANKSSQIG